MQRIANKNGTLTDECNEKLEELDFVYDMYEDQWNVKYNLLVKYYWEKGHSKVPVCYCTEDGIQLGKWLEIQRIQHKKGMLPDERKEKLEELDFVYEVLKNKWNAKYNLLVNYHWEKGHSNVPYKTALRKALAWVYGCTHRRTNTRIKS